MLGLLLVGYFVFSLLFTLPYLVRYVRIIKTEHFEKDAAADVRLV